jgi:hypothetical protein
MPLAARLADLNQILASPGTGPYGQAHHAIRNASSLSDALDRTVASTGVFSAYANEVAEGKTVLAMLAAEEERAVLDALRDGFDRGLVIEFVWEPLAEGQAVHARAAEDATRLVVTVSSPDGRTVS